MVCARSKVGKSTLLTNWATNLSIIDKLPILYIDTEMDNVNKKTEYYLIYQGYHIQK